MLFVANVEQCNLYLQRDIMVEHAPQIKVEEQYPLLKVDGGGDGATNPQVAPILVTTGWGVTCAPKQSWLMRWPGQYKNTFV